MQWNACPNIQDARCLKVNIHRPNILPALLLFTNTSCFHSHWSTNSIIHETHFSTLLDPFVFPYEINSFVITFKYVTIPRTICDTLLFQVLTKNRLSCSRKLTFLTLVELSSRDNSNYIEWYDWLVPRYVTSYSVQSPHNQFQLFYSGQYRTP